MIVKWIVITFNKLLWISSCCFPFLSPPWELKTSPQWSTMIPLIDWSSFRLILCLWQNYRWNGIVKVLIIPNDQSDQDRQRNGGNRNRRDCHPHGVKLSTWSIRFNKLRCPTQNNNKSIMLQCETAAAPLHYQDLFIPQPPPTGAPRSIPSKLNPPSIQVVYVNCWVVKR